MCGAALIIRADIVLTSNDASDLIYHVVHPRYIAWSTVLKGVQAAEIPFDQVAPEEWLRRLERTDEEDPSRHMLSMWQAAVCRKFLMLQS